MRIATLVLAAALGSAALLTPAGAYEGPPSTDEVTVEFNEPVNCVTFPCPQPPPVTVCVKRADYCTPR